MAETMSWRTLELGEEGVPQLLVKTRFDKDGYEIQLTDLSRIWGEKLRKREIVKRASDEGCSIDPSEDDQYDILLEKIGSALRGDKGTTLSLYSRNNGGALQLDLSAPLPGSLPTFVWNVKLERLPDSAVGLELVTPLVSQAARLRDQMQLLISELASKDHVIGKITDRLEASGNDLTAVFPGASGVKISRKRSQRGQLAGHVKGLADFDEQAWRASLKQGDDTPNLSSDLLNSVLDCLPLAEASVAADEWWIDLPDAAAKGNQARSRNGTSQQSQNSARELSQRQSSATNGQPTLRPEQSAEDEEFQRQGTPPQLKKNHLPADDEDGETDVTADEVTKPDELEDEETDDDDLDAAPSKAPSSQTKGRSQQQPENAAAVKASSPPPRKLGIIGGKKSRSPQPPPEPEHEAETEDEDMPAPAPEPRPKAKGKLGAFGGKKAASPQPAQPSEPDPEPVQESPPKKKSKLGAFGGASKARPASEEAPEIEKSAPKPRSKLGTFGGKSKTSTEAAPTDSPAPEQEVTTSPAKKRLGTMGGRSGSKSEDPQPVKGDPEPERQFRAPEKNQEPEEQEREDSQERADKKRERLKRELEEKSKAPVKKKRKF
ncbi:hypothetical protein PRZ48_005417 [Zasmidium cellare]|uniref:Non-homologous end-joining factor 1 n=1 Tax=Zasmidium cellare TaxID=395010 RepID=A0ABR0ETT4_ZASCE|nr:hypothetical protein PRZ48_005417 [Zasmidium cellare]